MTATTAPNPYPPQIWSFHLVKTHLIWAHLSLLFATVWTAVRPDGLASVKAAAGGPYHPDVLMAVHMITLGCIVTTCAGAWHAVGPLALRTPARAHWTDWLFLVALQVGAAGIASHMALGTYSGVTWSGGLLLVAGAIQVMRWLPPLLFADGPLPMRVGAMLAWCNLLLTMVMGGALALDRDLSFLPGGHYTALAGHAHLGLCGFAGTLAAAVGLRFLPMFLPAKPVGGVLPWIAVVGLGGGGFLMGAVLPISPEPAAFLVAWLCVLGGGAWLACWVLMILSPKPPPIERGRVNLAKPLLVCGLLCFAGALVQGTRLLLEVVNPTTSICVYGVFLLGGFTSMILGIGNRLLPVAAKLHGAVGSGFSPPSRRLQKTTLSCWLGGLAVLLVAVSEGHPAGVRAGALFLSVAVAADLGNVWLTRVPRRAKV